MKEITSYFKSIWNIYNNKMKGILFFILFLVTINAIGELFTVVSVKLLLTNLITDNNFSNASIDFIRDSWFGGHLLRPLLPGKTIEILEATTIDDKTCVQVKVILPNRQYYVYVLDSNRYQVAEESLRADGTMRYIKQSDFRNVSGLMLPFRSKLFTDGVLVQELALRIRRRHEEGHQAR